MRLHLVINSIIIFFLMISCSSLKQDIQQKDKAIINSELLRLNLTNNNEKIYLDFNLNKFFH
jgi:uncharacterized protein YcfL